MASYRALQKSAFVLVIVWGSSAFGAWEYVDLFGDPAWSARYWESDTESYGFVGLNPSTGEWYASADPVVSDEFVEAAGSGMLPVPSDARAAALVSIYGASASVRSAASAVVAGGGSLDDLSAWWSAQVRIPTLPSVLEGDGLPLFNHWAEWLLGIVAACVIPIAVFGIARVGARWFVRYCGCLVVLLVPCAVSRADLGELNTCGGVPGYACYDHSCNDLFAQRRPINNADSYWGGPPCDRGIVSLSGISGKVNLGSGVQQWADVVTAGVYVCDDLQCGGVDMWNGAIMAYAVESPVSSGGWVTRVGIYSGYATATYCGTSNMTVWVWIRRHDRPDQWQWVLASPTNNAQCTSAYGIPGAWTWTTAFQMSGYTSGAVTVDFSSPCGAFYGPDTVATVFYASSSSALAGEELPEDWGRHEPEEWTESTDPGGLGAKAKEKLVAEGQDSRMPVLPLGGDETGGADVITNCPGSFPFSIPVTPDAFQSAVGGTWEGDGFASLDLASVLCPNPATPEGAALNGVRSSLRVLLGVVMSVVFFTRFVHIFTSV